MADRKIRGFGQVVGDIAGGLGAGGATFFYLNGNLQAVVSKACANTECMTKVEMWGPIVAALLGIGVRRFIVHKILNR